MASFLTCPIWVFISLCWCVGVGAVFAAAQPTHFSLFGEKLCTSCHSRKRFASFRPRRERHTHTEATCLFAIVLWQARSSWRRLDTHAHTHTRTYLYKLWAAKSIRTGSGQAKFGFFSCLAVCVYVCVCPGYVCARTRLVIKSPVADSCQIREWGGERSNNNRIHLYPSFALRAPCCSFSFFPLSVVLPILSHWLRFWPFLEAAGGAGVWWWVTAFPSLRFCHLLCLALTFEWRKLI